MSEFVRLVVTHATENRIARRHACPLRHTAVNDNFDAPTLEPVA